MPGSVGRRWVGMDGIALRYSDPTDFLHGNLVAIVSSADWRMDLCTHKARASGDAKLHKHRMQEFRLSAAETCYEYSQTPPVLTSTKPTRYGGRPLRRTVPFTSIARFV